MKEKQGNSFFFFLIEDNICDNLIWYFNKSFFYDNVRSSWLFDKVTCARGEECFKC